MNYTKQAISFEDQLSMLRERGLIIEDDAKALQQLHSISYFRLASYLKPMECDSLLHLFRDNSHFEDAIKIYEFDKRLRGIIFMAIQDIEVALRTRIIHHFSMSYGPFWFMDSQLFGQQQIHGVCLDNVAKEVRRSREEFITEYYANYSSPEFPPAWKTMEVVSFGTLSKLFCNFGDVEKKKIVAKEFLLPQYLYLENWIKCLAVLRNACAHHARVWNRRFPMIPVVPRRLPGLWLHVGVFRPQKIYGHLCCMAYLEQSINPNCQFKQQLLGLLDNADRCMLQSMGFPQEWKDEPLWQ